MMTLTVESCSRMRRVASTPFITGISTSITTRSGTSSRAFSTAARPFSASPTTVMSSCPSISDAMAPRKSGWSSTSRMRIGSCDCILHLTGHWPGMRSLGDDRDNTRSAPRCGVDGKATVQQVYPFTHGVETEPVPVDQRLGRVEAMAVVLDDESRRRVGLGDGDDRRRSARMLTYVGQGLLDDPDHLDLATRRQGQRVIEVTVQRGCDLALLAVFGQIGAKVVQQPPLGPVRTPKAEDRLPDIPVGLLADIRQLSQLSRDLGAVPDLFARIERSQPQMGYPENLGQAVVHLAGDTPPLVQDRTLTSVLAHLGAGDRDRRQA